MAFKKNSIYVALLAFSGLVTGTVLFLSGRGRSNGEALVVAKDIKKASSPIDLSLLAKESGTAKHLAPVPVLLAPEKVKQVVVVEKNQTLSSVLSQNGVHKSEVASVIQAVKKVHNVRSIRAGQKLFLTLKPGGESQHSVEELEFSPSVEHKVFLTRKGEALEAEVKKVPLKRVIKVAKGVVNSSFYASACNNKVPLSIAHEAGTVLGYIVNMQIGIKRGASYRLVYEACVDSQGNEVKQGGGLSYVSIEAHGQTYQLYRYTDRSGRTGFYNANGEGVERSLLMTPLDVKKVRISSGFGMRIHPFRGYSVFHKGIDIPAARGTPVLAAGNGVVVEAGWRNGYGNYIRIRHAGNHETVYAHLQKIAKSVRRGTAVKQRQVIGLVGSTGHSTAPHLHHEVIVNGKHVNPLKIRQLPMRRLDGAELKNFLTKIKAVEKVSIEA